MTDERLYNTRNINTYIEYLKIYYPNVDLTDVLDYAEILPFELKDEGHWLTQRQIDRYFEILVKKTGNHNLARDVGRFAHVSLSAGALPQYVMGFLTPKAAYMALGKLYPYSSRSCKVTARSLGHNFIEVTAEQNPGVVEKPYQCENRLGIFESIGKLFTGNYATIEHPQCMHIEGNKCIYKIKWEQSQSFLWNRVRNYFTLIAIILSLLLSFAVPHEYRFIPFIIFLLTFIVMSLFLERQVKKDFEVTYKNKGNLAGDLLDQINIRYNNVLLIQEIGQYSSSMLDINILIKYIMEKMEARLDFDRGMIMLANDDRTRLVYIAGYGYPIELETLLVSAEFHLDNPQSRGQFVVSFKEQKPFLVNDMDETKDTISKRSLNFAKSLGVKSFICVPIIYEGISEGILAVDNVKSERPLDQSDMNLLVGIAQQIAIDINNARAYSLIRASEQRFRSLSENAPDIIYNIDVNGKITYINPAAESILGYRPDEIINRPLKEFIGPENKMMFKQITKSINTKSEIIKDVMITFPHKDGSERIFDISGAPNIDKNGDLIGVVGILRDITALKRSEKELKNSLDRLQKIMNSIILAISKIIESKDPYTSGHQERVSMISTSIAENMSLPAEMIEGIRIAATLHDIGKINVPAEILSSPRKLTEIEYGIIKMHSGVGYEILKDIEFNNPVAQIVLHHHEKMDGSGYPAGIRGDDILLEARIIAVADVVESMANHRPYRPALGIEKALAEIEAGRGTHYDPRVVDACLDLFRKGKISLT